MLLPLLLDPPEGPRERGLIPSPQVRHGTLVLGRSRSVGLHTSLDARENPLPPDLRLLRFDASQELPPAGLRVPRVVIEVPQGGADGRDHESDEERVGHWPGPAKALIPGEPTEDEPRDTDDGEGHCPLRREDAKGVEASPCEEEPRDARGVGLEYPRDPLARRCEEDIPQAVEHYRGRHAERDEKPEAYGKAPLEPTTRGLDVCADVVHAHDEREHDDRRTDDELCEDDDSRNSSPADDTTHEVWEHPDGSHDEGHHQEREPQSAHCLVLSLLRGGGCGLAELPLVPGPQPLEEVARSGRDIGCRDTLEAKELVAMTNERSHEMHDHGLVCRSLQTHGIRRLIETERPKTYHFLVETPLLFGEALRVRPSDANLGLDALDLGDLGPRDEGPDEGHALLDRETKKRLDIHDVAAEDELDRDLLLPRCEKREKLDELPPSPSDRGVEELEEIPACVRSDVRSGCCGTAATSGVERLLQTADEAFREVLRQVLSLTRDGSGIRIREEFEGRVQDVGRVVRTDLLVESRDRGNALDHVVSELPHLIGERPPQETYRRFRYLLIPMLGHPFVLSPRTSEVSLAMRVWCSIITLVFTSRETAYILS